MTVNSKLEPWLSPNDGEKAVAFYKSAFGAEETYRLNDPGGGLVTRLVIRGSGFWISSEGTGSIPTEAATALGGNNIRFVLIVPDPEKLFATAIAAGAKEIFPVGEGHGWKLGRIEDPFGLHWEIGYELS